VGSGNVFADLAHPRPAEALAKAELARKIIMLIAKRELSQAAAAEVLGVDQPSICSTSACNTRSLGIRRDSGCCSKRLRRSRGTAPSRIGASGSFCAAPAPPRPLLSNLLSVLC